MEPEPEPAEEESGSFLPGWLASSLYPDNNILIGCRWDGSVTADTGSNNKYHTACNLGTGVQT